MLLGVLPHGHVPRGLGVHTEQSACKPASRHPFRYVRFAAVLHTPAAPLVPSSPLWSGMPDNRENGFENLYVAVDNAILIVGLPKLQLSLQKKKKRKNLAEIFAYVHFL